jgi:hypothetical protein
LGPRKPKELNSTDPFPLTIPLPLNVPNCWLYSHTGFLQHCPGVCFKWQIVGKLANLYQGFKKNNEMTSKLSLWVQENQRN